MLTDAEEQYVRRIPEDLTVFILPYSSQSGQIAQTVTATIHDACPELEVLFLGAAGLGIAGRGDIDLYALSPSAAFPEYLPCFQRLFGESTHTYAGSIGWSFRHDGHEIELYLADPSSEAMQRQLRIFSLLASDATLRKDYESLKISMHGQRMREYHRRKYEFCDGVLANQGNRGDQTRDTSTAITR